ncbi:MAG: DUF5060 domain-containing protein [Bacteroidetes bacterium]|nr:DUF5060 domain-containing protein [Bacteroidota bacterium]
MRLAFILILWLVSTVCRSQAPVVLSAQVLHLPRNQYELLELRAEISTTVLALYDYDSIVFGGVFVRPGGDTLVIEGFYYQHFTNDGNQLIASGQPHFRLRFTPDEPGKWTYRLFVNDRNGSWQGEAQSFQILPGTRPGFLRFNPESAYLHRPDGEVVFLVGENIAWANTPAGGDSMTYYLGQLHAHGMNFAKLMMTPWAYQIEWIESGWRNYGGRQLQAFMMDSIFRMADSLGIYLQLALSIHNELNFGYPAEDWTSNPYNIANGGCCANAWEFFSHPAALSAFRNRLRYLAARWGYSTRLFAWELLSEADNFPWYRTYQQAIAQWSAQMAAYLKQKDHYRRAVSVGFALASSNPQVWQSPDIDFTQLHHYKYTPDIEGEIAALHATYLKSYNKPVLTGEFGLGHVGDSLVVWDPEGRALHNSLWTAAMTGSFGGVTPWFWENYIDAQQLYPVFTPLARFMNQDETRPDQLVPVHLPSASAECLPVVVNPRFDLLQRAPSNTFELLPGGIMQPVQDSLPVFLFGPQSLLAGLRNPPKFNGHWLHGGMMRISTGVQALNAIIQVRVDGQVWLEQNAQANTDYVLFIPPGTHQVQLDNRGQGLFSLLEINKITFENYAPSIRAFALAGTDRALAWVHNRHSHWQNAATGNIQPATGSISFPGLQGRFVVSFFNTYSGENDSIKLIDSGREALTLHFDALPADLALRIDPAPVKVLPAMMSEVRVFPNPFHDAVRIVPQPESGQVNLTLIITDLTGRVVYQSNAPEMPGGSFLWNGRTSDGFLVRQGWYIFRIFSDKGLVISGKIIRW